jgi:hypothetical protein
MRFRTVVVGVVAASTLATGSLTACGSSGGGSGSTSAPTTAPATTAPATSPGGTTAPATGNTTAAVATAKVCADLRQVGTQINSLLAKANDPAALKQALQSDGQLLTNLKNEAPTALAPVMASLSNLFHSAQQALSNPNKPDLQKLAVLATQVPAQAQKIQTWVQQNCKS